jgi:hypothetical protein
MRGRGKHRDNVEPEVAGGETRQAMKLRHDLWRRGEGGGGGGGVER